MKRSEITNARHRKWDGGQKKEDSKRMGYVVNEIEDGNFFEKVRKYPSVQVLYVFVLFCFALGNEPRIQKCHSWAVQMLPVDGFPSLFSTPLIPNLFVEAVGGSTRLLERA